jgi:hypothetical protein
MVVFFFFAPQGRRTFFTMYETLCAFSPGYQLKLRFFNRVFFSWENITWKIESVCACLVVFLCGTPYTFDLLFKLLNVLIINAG